MNKNKLYTELCIITPVLTYTLGCFVLLLFVVRGNTRKQGETSTSNNAKNNIQDGVLYLHRDAINETSTL